jgi:hypothetical protein
VLVVALDGAGSVSWAQAFGGAEVDRATGALAIGDDVIVFGHTASVGAGAGDAWVARLDKDGLVLWQRTYGGPLFDSFEGAALDGDLNLVLAGRTESLDAVDSDAFIVRLDGTNGALSWARRLTTGGSDPFLTAKDVAAGPDGFALAGFASTNDADWLVASFDPSGDFGAACTFATSVEPTAGSDGLEARDLAVGAAPVGIVSAASAATVEEVSFSASSGCEP